MHLLYYSFYQSHGSAHHTGVYGVPHYTGSQPPYHFRRLVVVYSITHLSLSLALFVLLSRDIELCALSTSAPFSILFILLHYPISSIFAGITGITDGSNAYDRQFEISERTRRYLPLLKQVNRLGDRAKRQLIKNCERVCEKTLQLRRLRRERSNVRVLASKKTSSKKKRRIL